jgi:hypothetical protein
MTLHRSDKQGRKFLAFHQGSRGIPLTDRANMPDQQKWSGRVHVKSEDEAIALIRKGYHLWMAKEDGTSLRASLISPASIEGWR